MWVIEEGRRGGHKVHLPRRLQGRSQDGRGEGHKVHLRKGWQTKVMTSLLNSTPSMLPYLGTVTRFEVRIRSEFLSEHWSNDLSNHPLDGLLGIKSAGGLSPTIHLPTSSSLHCFVVLSELTVDATRATGAGGAACAHPFPGQILRLSLALSAFVEVFPGGVSRALPLTSSLPLFPSKRTSWRCTLCPPPLTSSPSNRASWRRTLCPPPLPTNQPIQHNGSEAQG